MGKQVNQSYSVTVNTLSAQQDEQVRKVQADLEEKIEAQILNMEKTHRQHEKMIKAYQEPWKPTPRQASVQEQVAASVGALVSKQSTELSKHSAELVMMGTRISNLETDRGMGYEALKA